MGFPFLFLLCYVFLLLPLSSSTCHLLYLSMNMTPGPGFEVGTYYFVLLFFQMPPATCYTLRVLILIPLSYSYFFFLIPDIPFQKEPPGLWVRLSGLFFSSVFLLFRFVPLSVSSGICERYARAWWCGGFLFIFLLFFVQSYQNGMYLYVFASGGTDWSWVWAGLCFTRIVE